MLVVDDDGLTVLGPSTNLCRCSTTNPDTATRCNGEKEGIQGGACNPVDDCDVDDDDDDEQIKPTTTTTIQTKAELLSVKIGFCSCLRTRGAPVMVQWFFCFGRLVVYASPKVPRTNVLCIRC